ncbi:glycosyltransferase family 4 protein [Cecembia rubra]|uniref:Glycosyltransferase involved in cell wall biosynthesis n=1 Tax=Cecembia rubra TaxID=1485585 RepID=A0A2P8E3C8_9BACT|nr:glycosyltransferase family 4 protein [Cecembia rubra]PSL03964.1 glycosyltransferase involved in cell wall biosynthesis [Cecembia rubra]
MKILYFYQYFSTPKGSWGTRVYEFAKEWVAQGHEVTVVSSIYSKSDLRAEKWVEDQVFDGIRVKVLNVRIDNKQSFLKRIWSFVAYALLSSYYALTIKADVVVASSGPITAWLPGLLARFLRGRKLILEARDLWPEGAIELGIIKNPIVKRLAYAFENFSYQAANGIVGLSPGMQSHIAAKAPQRPVISVTNAANIKLFASKQNFQHPYLIPEKYAIYTGNIGEVNNSRWLLEAAKVLQSKGRSDIKIVLIGEGQQREVLVDEAKSLGLTNFIHIGLMPKSELVSLVQHAMASLVPLKGTPVLDTSSPNKFFESLAAGVPVIQNTKGWMKDFLEINQVGFTLDPNNSEALANLLIELDAKKSLKVSLGERAKSLAAEQFDKKILAKEMLDFIIDPKCVYSSPVTPASSEKSSLNN